MTAGPGYEPAAGGRGHLRASHADREQMKELALHWAVVVVPILVSVLIAVASRRAVGQRWVMLRAAAQSIKAAIY